MKVVGVGRCVVGGGPVGGGRVVGWWWVVRRLVVGGVGCGDNNVRRGLLRIIIITMTSGAGGAE